MNKKLLSLLTVAFASFAFGQYETQNINVPLQYAAPQVISIVDANTLWSTVRDGSGNGTYPRFATVTTNGGQTWASKAISAPSNALISDIHGVDGQNAFVVTAPASGSGAANGLYKTTNGGTNWSKITGVFGNASFGNIVHFFNAQTGLVIGDPVNNKYEMYKTTDGGNTWSVLSTAPTPLIADEYGYVGGKIGFGNSLWLTSNTGRILHTTDFGATWNSYVGGPVDDFSGENSNASMSFSSESYGLLVDNIGFLWFTEDAGANWDIKETTGYYNGDIKYIPGSNANYITTGISTTSPLGIGSSYTNDGGNTWVSIDADDQRGQIAAYDCSNIWVGQFTSDAAGTGGMLKLAEPVPGCSLSTTETNVIKAELKAVVSNGILNIVTNKDIKDVVVGDMSAKSILTSTKKEVNVSQLKSGVYYARVAYADGSLGTVKFVVK
ncbi:MAG: hypothetical protein KIG88_01095 [Weeksellaceae bacterium]|nr:hypothetical protein [Weeksellaceae bacterium]